MKSVFENMQDKICKEIKGTKSLTDLKEKLNEILEEWDLEEEEN